MKHKKYTINNLEDMLNCINSDNIDNFLSGFDENMRRYLDFISEARKKLKNSGVDESKLKNTEILKNKNFIFIDDGKQENEIKIITK